MRLAINRTVVVVVVAVAGLAALVSGGTWAYINLVRDEAPARLTLQDNAPTTAAAADSAAVPIDETWTVADGSTAGYRVNEVLFGQKAEAAGRTSKVTGEFVIADSEVTSGSFTVDMGSITSDQSRRDGQFRGRIMSTSQFPTSTFVLTEPIALAAVPPAGGKVSVEATGRLTLRGTTKLVTVPLEAERAGNTVRVLGAITIVFDEWNIPNPSGGPAQTEDQGELEFLLVFTRA